MIYNPYECTFGSIINIKNTIGELEKFMITNGTRLSYEYKEDGDAKLLLITGKDNEEKSLPLWEHPLVIKDIKGNTYIAVDLRKFVKPNDTFINISEIIRDYVGFNYIITNAIVTCEVVNGNYGKFRSMEKTIASAYSYWLANSLTSGILLDPGEKVNIEIVAQHFIYMNMVNGQIGPEHVNIAINKIASSKLSLPINIKTIKSVVDTLNHNVSTIDDLVANMKIVLGDIKADMINTNTLVNIINNSWYGPGGNETVIIAVEHIPTWIAMLYVSSTNKSYSRTRLATILDKVKVKIKLSEFTKSMELYLKESVL